MSYANEFSGVLPAWLITFVAEAEAILQQFCPTALGRYSNYRSKLQGRS